VCLEKEEYLSTYLHTIDREKAKTVVDMDGLSITPNSTALNLFVTKVSL
jgi:hypothetical protein